MKIAVFYNLPEGGAKRTAEEQIKRLRKKHEVDVFKSVGSPPRGWSRLKTDFFKFWKLRKTHQMLALKIDKGGYDVTLVHPCCFTQAPYLLRYLKTPKVYFCQEPLRICYEYNLHFKEKVGNLKKIYEELTRRLLKKIDFENTRSATSV
ncbi:hypothetical protein HZB97_01820, partial [Candidatus Gottesmanbacteria bacterium]|nr:hypothetical protein [Candidatus Gottesmanbacteria bacterium]